MEYKTVVYKANSLVKASFKLSLNEQRLILACIAQIENPNHTLSRDDEFTVTAPYFSRLFDVSPKNSYAELGEAARQLANREVVINQPDPDNPKISRLVTGWVDYAQYYDGEGKVVIRFREKMLPYLSNLTNGCFTKYKINMIAKIKSAYAIRLYEILVSENWLRQEFEIEVQELKIMFQLNGEYERIFDFKKNILDPAIKSINKHTDMTVEYSQRKTGREVTHFIFTYSIHGANEESKPPRLTDDYVEKNALPGESWPEARKRLSKKHNGV